MIEYAILRTDKKIDISITISHAPTPTLMNAVLGVFYLRIENDKGRMHVHLESTVAAIVTSTAAANTILFIAVS